MPGADARIQLRVSHPLRPKDPPRSTAAWSMVRLRCEAGTATRYRRHQCSGEQQAKPDDDQQRGRRRRARQLVETGESFRDVARHRGLDRVDAGGLGRRHVDRDEARVLAHQMVRQRDVEHGVADVLLRRALATGIHQRVDLGTRPQDGHARLRRAAVHRQQRMPRRPVALGRDADVPVQRAGRELRGDDDRLAGVEIRHPFRPDVRRHRASRPRCRSAPGSRACGTAPSFSPSPRARRR